MIIEIKQWRFHVGIGDLREGTLEEKCKCLWQYFRKGHTREYFFTVFIINLCNLKEDAFHSQRCKLLSDSADCTVVLSLLDKKSMKVRFSGVGESQGTNENARGIFEIRGRRGLADLCSKYL